MISKLALAQLQFQKHLALFRCPLCFEPFDLKAEEKSLVCLKGHAFDIAKKGYVNFHPQGQNHFYNSALFKARRDLFEQDFFAPITRALISILKKAPAGPVLDAGCGDGAHIAALGKHFDQRLFLGIDLSKQGIGLATDHFNPDFIFSVGDIANPPYTSKAFAVILNILSPANYPSFKRCLKKGGLVIKVIPGDDYLKELRQLLKKEVNPLEGRKVFDWMDKNTHILQTLTLKDGFSLGEEQYRSLLQMTPLVATLPTEETTFLTARPLQVITRHWQVVVAEFK